MLSTYTYHNVIYMGMADLYWSILWQIGKSLDVNESHLSLHPILLDTDSLTQAVKL